LNIKNIAFWQNIFYLEYEIIEVILWNLEFYL